MCQTDHVRVGGGVLVVLAAHADPLHALSVPHRACTQAHAHARIIYARIPRSRVLRSPVNAAVTAVVVVVRASSTSGASRLLRFAGRRTPPNGSRSAVQR